MDINQIIERLDNDKTLQAAIAGDRDALKELDKKDKEDSTKNLYEKAALSAMNGTYHNCNPCSGSEQFCDKCGTNMYLNGTKKF